ncbi:hypothetical protein BDV41DRAFT_289942 [Aspergillus transmontanensis]|uniref:Uncharacterized protein n=1 Tax=Aspergillus transmontanensis TaxID=1034304 RepID=A0A5N6WE06_9EURO|nr:hypothetical protein BDV41DRAFT_289942 [Aspergillus transmontanensis]
MLFSLSLYMEVCYPSPFLFLARLCRGGGFSDQSVPFNVLLYFRGIIIGLVDLFLFSHFAKDFVFEMLCSVLHVCLLLVVYFSTRK